MQLKVEIRDADPGYVDQRRFDKEQVLLNGKAPTRGAFAEPSDRLEPSTPSLPFWGHGNRSQPTATKSICD
jgi:hypothetical protein